MTLRFSTDRRNPGPITLSGEFPGVQHFGIRCSARLVWACDVNGTEHGSVGSATGIQSRSEFPLTEKSGQVLVRTMSEIPADFLKIVGYVRSSERFNDEPRVLCVGSIVLFGSLLTSMERFRCGRCPTQEALRAEIFVDIRPVNAVPSSTDFPI